MRVTIIKRILPVLVLALTPLLAVVPVSAAADTCTWTGAANIDSANAGNWTGCDNTNQPEAGDALVFPAGATTSIVAWNTALNFESITFTGDNYVITPGTETLATDYISFIGNSNVINSDVSIISNAGTNGWFGGGTSNEINGDVALNIGGANDIASQVNGSLEISGVISGAIDDLTNQSSTATGTLTLSGVNTFTGNIILNSGVMDCSSANCFGDDANVVREVTSSSTGKFLFSSSLSLDNDISLFSDSNTDAIEIADGVDITHTGALTLNINADVNMLIGSGTASYINTGNITLSSATHQLDFIGEAGTSSIVRFNGVANSAAGSEISVENAILYMGNGGPLGTFTGLNGDLRAKGDSVLSATRNDALGTTTGDTTLEAGSRMSLGSNTPSLPENITVTGDATIFRSASAGNDSGISGDITLTADLTLDPGASAGDLNMTGEISGTGNITAGHLFSSGGTLRLASPTGNSYIGSFTVEDGALVQTITANQNQVTGDLTIDDGQFTINSANTVSDSANVTVNTGATFSVFDEDTIASLAGTGTLELGDTLTIAGSTDTTFTGDVSGTDNIVYSGSGTLNLSPSNGSTNPGTVALEVANGTVTSDIDITKFITSITGGTLSGKGVFSTTTLTTGAFAPGNSPGCNTVSGDLNLNGGSFIVELDGTTACTEYDQTTVTGTVNIAGATLTVTPGFTATVGDVFTIIDSDTLTGTFSGLADGSTVGVNGQNFRINYADGAVTLTALAQTVTTPVADEETTVLSNTGSNIIVSLVVGSTLLLMSGAMTLRRQNI